MARDDGAGPADPAGRAGLAGPARAGSGPSGPARLGRLGGPWSGRVACFDDAAGRGIVEVASGERFGFHCTSLADGSRHAEPGAQVVFGLWPGSGGEIEAVRIVDAPAGAPGAQP